MRTLMFRRTAMLAVGVLLAAEVAAQWAWKDDSGRLVFSDRPPPASVKPEQIVRQPGPNVSQPPLRSSEEAARDASKASAAKGGATTTAEREMEFRKRQTERAEAEKKAAEEQQLAQRRQQECERSRGYLRALEDGLRVSRTDAQGNREFLDDNQRNAEMARAREMIERNCKG
ncbi:MAG: DUF4124 domain-containing protein [Betaproteobacteria bacterium]|jgi:hypothetical protein